MNNWIARLPIKSKLTLIVMLANIAGLLLAGVIIAAYDDRVGRREMLEDISTIALLIADRSTAALAFDDARLAEENLSALRVKPSVTFACIYAENGSRFASYPPLPAGAAAGASVAGPGGGSTGALVFPHAAVAEGRHEFRDGELVVYEPITLNSRRIGALQIKASLAELVQRRRNTLSFISALILATTLAVYFLSLWLQRMITRPLAHLTETARHIAVEKDYSVRAVRSSDDETGLLVTAFNEMLETIDERNRSNERYRLRQEELIESQGREISERKRVELELRESEEKFQRVFMSSPEAIAIIKLSDASYVDVNENFTRLFGFRREELIGKSAIEYTIARNRAECERFEAAIKNDGKVREFEAEYCSRDGKTGFVMISAETIKIGSELCLLKQYKDITARVLAQRALKASEDRYRAIFEKVGAGIFQTSPEGRILIANPAFARILGYDSPEELISSVGDIARGVYLNPDVRGWLLELISRQGSVSGFETAALKKNGEIISVSINKHVVRDDDGKPVYYEGTMEDVTVQKRFEELKSAMNIAQIGYWEYDAAGDSFVANDGFFAIFHTTAEKTGGGGGLAFDRFAELFGGAEGAPALREEIRKAVATENPDYKSQIETRISYSDTGEEGYVHYIISVAKDAAGRTVKVYGAAQDITRMKKQIFELEAARETAEKATRFKSEFLAKMSHEIRTPLGAVIGLNNLLDKTALDKKQKDYVAKIKNSAGYLLQVINDILDFTKIESGRMELEKTEFSFEDILEDVGDFASIKSMEKDVEIVIDKDPDVPRRLTGDPLRIKQVLLNLMNNAIKFTEKGSVVLKIKPYKILKGRIELDFSVSDTGIGMTPLQVENLFQAYSQADVTTSRKYGGTGLGLNICYKFIDMMGGRLNVRSEPGSGSEFFFTLSFDLPGEPEAGVARSLPERLKDMRVLVADDSELFRKVIEKYVKRLGLSCHTAEDGPGAVEALKEKPFDVLFIDCNLPGMNGFETIKKIRDDASIGRKPKIVFVTTISSDAALKEVEMTGIANVLFKPLNESVIFNTLVNLFGGDERDMTIRKAGPGGIPDGFAAIRGARILVAEDNEINQQIIREILENQGFEVFIAPDGRRCVEMFDELGAGGLDLILMDVQMPEMDGIEAAEAIRGKPGGEKVRIVALTADVIKETRERISRSGIDDFVSKPIDESELFRAIVKWIDPAGIKNPLRPVAGAESDTGASVRRNDEAPAAVETSINVSGFDAPGASFTDGLRRVTGNEELYRGLLQKYKVSCATLVAECREHIRKNEFAQLSRRTHNFKGVSANLGFSLVASAAAELHSAAEASDGPAAERLADLLEARMEEALAAASRYLAAGAETGKSPAKAPAGEREFLESLAAAVASDPMASRDLFEEYRESFGLDGRAEYCELCDAMGAYDFGAAEKELKTLLDEKKEGKDDDGKK